MEQLVNNEPLQIDINKVIGNKNPGLLKILPRFLINYIKRTIHQDEINYVLKTYGDRYGVDFVNAVLDYFNLKIIIKGEENIPKSGKYIFAANHPLGGLEGMAMISVVARYHKDVRFIVNDILMNLKNYEPIFIPVNKHGSHSKEYAQWIENAYCSDAQILYFPAGLVSRKIKGKITDLEWKKNFITKSVQHQRDVVPVFIEGRNSNFFYNFANFRKTVGIKANIEMIYLPDEMFRQKNKTIVLHFGKSIPCTTFDNSKTQSEWAGWVKEIVYGLGS
ncbi:MAG: glycerol acyltransferase [Bacteroidia bacterium]|nr:glycerol acyltransferase [Bacteroidia bacterium]